MKATARLLEQRSSGDVHLRMERNGIAVLREAGSSKVRVPRGSHEAILINTSGGLAGGDRVSIVAEVGPQADLVLTSQTAERVYRTLGPAAEIDVSLRVAAAGQLLWLPQETILYENASLRRTFDVDLAADAQFMMIEPLVFGRQAMGEVVQHVALLDRWTIKQNDALIHSDILRLGPHMPHSRATLGGYSAMAAVVLISADVESLIEPVRAVLGPQDGASAWNGKLIARLVASDGYSLRKRLLKLLVALDYHHRLPKTWTF